MQLGFLDRTPRGRIGHRPRVRVLQDSAQNQACELGCFEQPELSYETCLSRPWFELGDRARRDLRTRH